MTVLSIKPTLPLENVVKTPPQFQPPSAAISEIVGPSPKHVYLNIQAL